MRIYGLKNCDTCRKARAALVAAEFVDVREDGIAPEVLGRALAEFGDALVNRKSTTWRGLSEAERVRAPLDLLRDHPALMKRPLFDDGARMLLGWDKAVQATLLGS